MCLPVFGIVQLLHASQVDVRYSCDFQEARYAGTRVRTQASDECVPVRDINTKLAVASAACELRPEARKRRWQTCRKRHRQQDRAPQTAAHRRYGMTVGSYRSFPISHVNLPSFPSRQGPFLQAEALATDCESAAGRGHGRGAGYPLLPSAPAPHCRHLRVEHQGPALRHVGCKALHRGRHRRLRPDEEGRQGGCKGQ